MPTTPALNQGLAAATDTLSAIKVNPADANLTVVSPATFLLSLEDTQISEDRISEDRSSRTRATLTRSPEDTSELTVTLSTDNGEAIVPNTVTFEAGQTTTSFDVRGVNDNLVDGTQTTMITASASGFVSGTARVDVVDSNVPTLSLLLGANTIAENGHTTAGIVRNSNITVPLTVSLASSDTSEATVPSQVTFNRGERLAVFSIAGVEDGVVDSTQTTVISASAAGFTGNNAAPLAVTNTTVKPATLTDTTIFVDENNTIQGRAFSAGEQYQGLLFSNTDASAIPDDVIVGTEGNDNILAGDRGNDWIDSKGGDDLIGIGRGNVSVSAGQGDDFVYSLDNSIGNNAIDLGEGNNTVWMEGGNNTITSGAGDDVIGLGTGAAIVRAGDGNNIIYKATAGASGNKDVITGTGDDYIALGAGDDVIDGGRGLNTLLGGAGVDTFVIRKGAYNFLGDFDLGTDKIKLVDVNRAALTFVQGSGDKASSVFGFAGEEALFEVVNATTAEVSSNQLFA